MHTFSKYNHEFWKALDVLLQSSDLCIDRPKGSIHPQYPDFIYPVDYGYLKDTISMDGQGIDILIGSENNKVIDSILCTVDSLKRDSEIKILYGCTAMEKERIYDIYNEKFMNAILIERYTS